MNTPGRQRGFTIIELMIVVALVGILAAIAVPAYQTYITRAKVSEAAMVADAVKLKMTEFVLANGAFPADNAAAGVDAPPELGGRYVRSVTVAPNGVLLVEFGDPALAGLTITLTATADDARVVWSCATTLPEYLRPKYCP